MDLTVQRFECSELIPLNSTERINILEWKLRILKRKSTQSIIICLRALMFLINICNRPSNKLYKDKIVLYYGGGGVCRKKSNDFEI